MAKAAEVLAVGAAIGIGGSVCIDVWSLGFRRLAGVSTLDYAMLGGGRGGVRGARVCRARRHRVGAPDLRSQSGLLAVLAERLTDQPQRCASVPSV